jgi:tetratricopeptide (TPR) repeat protein
MALSPSGPPKCNRTFFLVSLALIVLAGILVYANSLGGQLVWDDETLVRYNPYIKDWSYLPKIFTSRLGSVAKEAGAFYRPVQTFTYLVDYSIGRLNVRGYHLTNMAWHILAALSLFGLIQMLFRDGKLSLLTALLFIVHPVHTEAVAYISGRADSLAAFFMFCYFILYLKHDEKPGGFLLGAMAVSYVLALLSKELSLILPPLVFFYHYAFAKPLDKKAFSVLAGTLIGYILWRLLVVGGGTVAEGIPPAFFARLPGVFVALTNYYRLLVLPFDLHMEYGGLLFPYSQPKAIVGVGLLALTLLYVSNKKRRDPFLFFAVGWFFITLLPSSNFFFPINAYMAEHWLYLPSVGFFLIVARFLIALYEDQKHKGIAIVVIIGLLVFYCVLTVRQNSYWNNGINFYKRMLYYAPSSSRLYNNLAKAYHDAGKNDELIEILRSAIQLQPDNALAHNNLGNAYKETGNLKEAIRSYQQAIVIDPKHAGPYYNLSTIYSDMGGKEKKDEAIALLNKSIELSPNFAKSYNKLGLIYLERGEMEKTIELLNRALKLNPDDPEVYHSLGYVYIQTGESRMAVDMYLKAIKADPNYVSAYNDLAIIYFTQKKYAKAIEYCDKAASLGSSNPSLLEAIKPYR